MEINEEQKERVRKSVKAVSFLKDLKGKLKRTNDYSWIGAAVRSMIEGGVVKTNYPSHDYIKEE